MTKEKNTPLKSKQAGKAKSTQKQKKAESANNDSQPEISTRRAENEFGLSVRIEINLPSDASRETYDDIFKSIRENLINA